MRNVPLLDAFTIANSLTGGAILGQPVPATIVSADIEWSGITRRVEACNAAKTYAGTYVENTATIAVTAVTPSRNFKFVSDPASTMTNFAEIGHERNGVFFDECE